MLKSFSHWGALVLYFSTKQLCAADTRDSDACIHLSPQKNWKSYSYSSVPKNVSCQYSANVGQYRGWQLNPLVGPCNELGGYLIRSILFLGNRDPDCCWLIWLWDNEDKRRWGQDVEDATLRTGDFENKHFYIRHWGQTMRTNIFPNLIYIIYYMSIYIHYMIYTINII